MDRAILLQDLAQAQRHVSEGDHSIAKQEARVAKLDLAGHDTAEARKMLATMRNTQTLHEEDVIRILSALSRKGRLS